MISRAYLMLITIIFMGHATTYAAGLSALRRRVATIAASPRITPKIPRINPFTMPQPGVAPRSIQASAIKPVAVARAFSTLSTQKSSISAQPSLFHRVKNWLMALFGSEKKGENGKSTQGPSAQELPAFTVGNIKKYPQHKDHFINIAREQLTSMPNPLPIIVLLETFPDAAVQLTDIALEKFAAVSKKVLQLILQHNPPAEDGLIQKALTTENKHLSWIVGCASADEWMCRKYGWLPVWLPTPFVPLRVKIMCFTQDHIGGVSIDQIPIKNLEILYNVSSDLEQAAIKKIALKKYGQPEINEVIELRRSGINPNGRLGWAFKSFERSKPGFLYTQANDAFEYAQPSESEINRLLVTDHHLLKPENLEYAYLFCSDTHIRAAIVRRLEQLYGQPEELCLQNLLKKESPFATQKMQMAQRYHHKTCPIELYKKCSVCTCQSSAHLFHHLPYVVNLMASLPIHEHNKKFGQKLLSDAYTIEQQETAKGSYVFYHGRQYIWDFISDMYKQVYNLAAQPGNKLANDQQFLRFDNSCSKFIKDCLFLNSSLFGNSSRQASSSAYYVLTNMDQSLYSKDNPANRFRVDWIFNQFKLEKFYEQHWHEFEQLKKLHAQANPSKMGNLLVVATHDTRFIHHADIDGNKFIVDIDQAEIKESNLSAPKIVKTADPVQILNAIKANPKAMVFRRYESHCFDPNADTLQFALDLSKSEARNPHNNGLKIYSLTACDPAKRKEYEDYRDQLFNQIKAEMAADGVKFPGAAS